MDEDVVAVITVEGGPWLPGKLNLNGGEQFAQWDGWVEGDVYFKCARRTVKILGFAGGAAWTGEALFKSYVSEVGADKPTSHFIGNGPLHRISNEKLVELIWGFIDANG